MRPAEILAVDWGAKPAKRQLCRAVLRGGRYALERPHQVASAAALPLLPNTLVALDVPLGLPAGWARAAGLGHFRQALGTLGSGRFASFYAPCADASELAVERPFYPAKAGGASRAHQKTLFGEDGLYRKCDLATGAESIFWTLGPKQVGKSAIDVWTKVVAPRADELALWPFDGPLERLVALSKKPVVAEMYPSFLRKTLGIMSGSKRDRDARASEGALVLDQAKGIDVIAVRDLLLDGFGESPESEDAFDATIACLALTRLVVDGALAEPPDEARRIEGWILGL